MNVLRFPGLTGSNPLGAMAAFGLLRILDVERPFGAAKLSWSFDADWRPDFHIENACTISALIEFLIERQTARMNSKMLTWHDDIKCPPTRFRELWQTILTEFVGGTDLSAAFENAAFATAYGSELILDKKAKPDVKPTAFHMTAGQQRFLKSIKDLASSLDPKQLATKRQSTDDRLNDIRSAYQTALAGPWTYQDCFHSLGWDPATEGLYALSDASPSDSGARSVRAAVWLAFESLPLFPSVPSKRRLHTSAFDQSGNGLTWPIWEHPISPIALAILLGSREFAEDEIQIAKLQARGIVAVMRSQCARDANARGTFRNSASLTGA